MRQIGVIERITGREATVRIQRASACGENCASCAGGCEPMKTTVQAELEFPCEPGDRVIIEMPNGRIAGAAALVYALPVLCLIGGYFIGGMFSDQELFRALAALGAMLLCWGAVAAVDKKLKNIYRHSIVKKIGHEDMQSD